jgi:hypothetical protein
VIADGLCADGQRAGCALALGAGWAALAAPIAPIEVNASNAAQSSVGREPFMLVPSPFVNVINCRIRAISPAASA